MLFKVDYFNKQFISIVNKNQKTSETNKNYINMSNIKEVFLLKNLISQLFPLYCFKQLVHKLFIHLDYE